MSDLKCHPCWRDFSPNRSGFWSRRNNRWQKSTGRSRNFVKVGRKCCWVIMIRWRRRRRKGTGRNLIKIIRRMKSIRSIEEANLTVIRLTRIIRTDWSSMINSALHQPQRRHLPLQQQQQQLHHHHHHQQE